MNETLEKQKDGESLPQNYREVAIGEGALGHAWDKIGAKLDLAGAVTEDPLKRPFFIKTEEITHPDGSVTAADTYIVVNDVVIDLNRTKANKPDVMSFEKALHTGVLPGVIEVGKPAGKAGVVDSVVWYYGNGYPDELSSHSHGTLLFDVEELIDDHTGKTWQEFVEEKTGKVLAQESKEKTELSEVAKSNLEAMQTTELGQEVAKAYQWLIAEHPELADVPIVIKTPQEANGNTHSVDRSTGEPTINLRLDKQLYSDFMQNPGFADRFERFIQLQSELGRQVTEEDLAVFTMLHEFGHTKDYLQRKADNPDMSPADFAASDKAKRKAEMKTLPLPGGSRTFMRAYEAANDTGKAQALAIAGVTTETELQQLARITDRAYAHLPSEKVADDFALQEYRKFNEV